MRMRHVALACCALLLMSGTQHAQVVGDLWLIESSKDGEWTVQEGRHKPRAMDKYEALARGDKITCVKAPCALSYLFESGEMKAFPPSGPLKPGVLFMIQTTPSRAGAATAANASSNSSAPSLRKAEDFQELIAHVAIRGGRRKDSPTCFGEFPLVAPSCGETIDVADFRLRWTATPDAGKLVTVMLGGADSSERRRWNVPADAGEFRSKAVEDYLASLQLPDRPTDVTIRLVRTENLSATRLVRLPSRADDAEYRKKLQAASLMPDLPKNLTLLEHFLRMQMWSKAAAVSEQLLRDAPHSLEIRKYAMVGLCHSDLADQIAKLRTSLKEEGVTGFCEAERGSP